MGLGHLATMCRGARVLADAMTLLKGYATQVMAQVRKDSACLKEPHAVF